jgi:hypothetical protein
MPLTRIEIEQTAARWTGSVEAGGVGLAGRRTLHFDAASAEDALIVALQAYREILGVTPPRAVNRRLSLLPAVPARPRAS